MAQASQQWRRPIVGWRVQPTRTSKVERMQTNSSPTNVGLYDVFDRGLYKSSQADMLLSLDRRSWPDDGRDERVAHQARLLQESPTADAADHAVQIAPFDAVKRRAATWDGMA